MRVPLQKSRSPAEKIQHIVGVKHPRTGSMMRVRRTVLLYPCHPCHAGAQLSIKRDSFDLWFFPWGKMTVCERVPGSPSCAGHCPRGPLPLHPIQNAEVICMLEGLEGALRTAARVWNSSKGPTNCFMSSICKPAHEPQCMPHLWTLLCWPMGTLTAVQISPTHRSSVRAPCGQRVWAFADSWHAYAKSWPDCEIGRKQNLSISGHCPREREEEALTTWSDSVGAREGIKS